jgi:hypothetical protein
LQVSGDPEKPDDELNGLRIRQLAVLHRAAYRSRSYCIIAVIVCIVGIVQLIHETIQAHRGGGGLIRQMGYIAAAVALLVLGIRCAKWARHFHKEAKQTSLSTPRVPPDFSNLSDGSQHAKNLENM